jgi:hypothetical protein
LLVWWTWCWNVIPSPGFYSWHLQFGLDSPSTFALTCCSCIYGRDLHLLNPQSR